MAARRVFKGENGDEFLKKLMASPMIKITYEDNERPAELCLPEVLVCDVSSGIRHLCDQNHKRTFTVNEVLGESQSNFAARMKLGNSKFTDILACFARWLYSGLAKTQWNYQHDLWYFGQRIGAPRFQDAVLHALCLDYYSLSIEDALVNHFRKGEVENIWNFAYPAQDQHGREVEEEDFKEQKMLMFALDCMVYLGLDNSDVRELLFAGGPLTLQLAKRMAVAPRAGEVHHPPWHPANFDKYFLDETTRPSDLDELFGLF